MKLPQLVTLRMPPERWMTAAQIGALVDCPSREVSQALARMVAAGSLDVRESPITGHGRRFEYRRVVRVVARPEPETYSLLHVQWPLNDRMECVL